MAHLILLLALTGLVLSSAIAAPTTNEPECKRITAAVAFFGNSVLFFGNDYAQFNQDKRQMRTGRTYTDFNVPYPDATVIFSLNNYDYTFSGSYYFSRLTDYAPVDAEVFGGATHGDFFKNGLDAAGNINGVTAFFKGCNWVRTFPDKPSDVEHVPEGVPCNLDAALTAGQDLWLLKGDKMWVMSQGGSHISKPQPISDVFQFNGITLCKDTEE